MFLVFSPLFVGALGCNDCSPTGCVAGWTLNVVNRSNVRIEDARVLAWAGSGLPIACSESEACSWKARYYGDYSVEADGFKRLVWQPRMKTDHCGHGYTQDFVAILEEQASPDESRAALLNVSECRKEDFADD